MQPSMSHRIQRATQIATQTASFQRTTHITFRLSASRPVPSDRSLTQIGVQGPTQIDLFLLVRGSKKKSEGANKKKRGEQKKKRRNEKKPGEQKKPGE